MRWLCLGFASACAASAFALSAPAPTAAALPCWKTAIADWSKDNSIDGRYSASCLRQAMVSAPTDLKIYSSLEDDLRAAMRVRSSRRLAGAHTTVAAALPSSGSSALSPLVVVLAGIAVLVATCTVGALVRRRRAAR